MRNSNQWREITVPLLVMSTIDARRNLKEEEIAQPEEEERALSIAHAQRLFC